MRDSARDTVITEGAISGGQTLPPHRVPAYHEAGHAVVARLLNVPVQSANLEDGVITVFQPNDPISRRKSALIALAGAAAEQQLCAYSREQRRRLWNTEWRRDRLNAINHLRAAGGSRSAAWAKACRLIQWHWPGVIAVARRLEAGDTLRSAEIDTLSCA